MLSHRQPGRREIHVTVTEAPLPARERILAAASRQYYAQGIRAASADRILAEAGVSKVTFYRHFPTKDDLVVAYLEATARAEQAALRAERAAHPEAPAMVLRWYARVVGELSCGPGFRGCPFINAAAELPDPGHPGRRLIADHRAWLTAQCAELLGRLGVTGAEQKATQLMMLRDGAMLAGYVGDPTTVAADLVAAATAVLRA
jgi:AcrR family transcriptional regulator